MVHFRCHHHLGKNKEAIDDAMAACEIQPSSGDCREGVIMSNNNPPPSPGQGGPGHRALLLRILREGAHDVPQDQQAEAEHRLR